MSKLWVGAILLAILALQYTGAAQQGFSVTCINEACRASASTSLPSVVSAALLIGFVFAYRQRSGVSAHDRPVRTIERFGAFLVDFVVVLSGIGPLLALPFLWVEALHTGTFQWSFERPFARASDAAVGLPSILLMFLGLFLYFYGHAVAGRQTVGQHLFGYRVEGAPGATRPAYGRNVLLSFIGLSAWPLSVFLAQRRADKAFWWNLRTRTRLVFLRNAETGDTPP